MSKPLEVTITVGTSFSIGGNFAEPDLKKPVGERSIYCDGNGLDFMLDRFAVHNISASFFIETAQHCYFGDEPMGRVVDKIQKAGQDTQLMVHPCWYYYDKENYFSQNDSCVDRPYEELKEIIKRSLENFVKLTGKKPQVFRAGNCQVDRQLYKILHELEIPMSSSVGLGMYIAEGKEFLLYNGRLKINDVMEVPLCTYQDKDVMGRYPTKTLQISSCSWREMQCVLKKARKIGIKNVVLLTQPFDYIKKKDMSYREITVNRVNQLRLEKLCSFIDEHDQDFVSVDFAEKTETWKDIEQEDIKKFRIPSRYRNGRKIENFINDKFWNF